MLIRFANRAARNTGFTPLVAARLGTVSAMSVTRKHTSPKHVITLT